MRACVFVRDAPHDPPGSRDRCGRIETGEVRDGKILLWFGLAGIQDVPIDHITYLGKRSIERYPHLRTLLPDVPIFEDEDWGL